MCGHVCVLCIYPFLPALRQLGGCMYLPELWSFWAESTACQLPDCLQDFLCSYRLQQAESQYTSSGMCAAWALESFPVKLQHSGSVCSMGNFQSTKSHGPPWQGYRSHAVKCPLHCVVQGSDLVEKNTVLFVCFDSPSFSPKIISVLDHFHDPVPCKASQTGMSSRVGR